MIRIKKNIIMIKMKDLTIVIIKIIKDLKINFKMEKENIIKKIFKVDNNLIKNKKI